MRRFQLPPDWDGGPSYALRGKDAKRLSAVLRLGPGDRFPAMGPDGAAYECSVRSVGRGEVVLGVEPAVGTGGSERFSPIPDVRAGRPGRSSGAAAGLPAAKRPAEHDRDSAEGKPAIGGPAALASASYSPRRIELPRLCLAVGVLKGSGLDEVARAAAEAGVAEIVPLITARSVRAEDAGGRTERLRRVVAEALSQSGSAVATAVAAPVRLAELAASRRPAPGGRLCLFFHEAPLAHGSLHSYCSVAPLEIVACVGPEGGFDDAETAGLIEAGYLPGWLGPTVLRAGTAAIFAVAALRAICLERSSWSTVE